MKELRENLQAVADLAGKPTKEAEFSSQYESLLTELTAALKVMRAIATMQAVWLNGQSERTVRMN